MAQKSKLSDSSDKYACPTQIPTPSDSLVLQVQDDSFT